MDVNGNLLYQQYSINHWIIIDTFLKKKNYTIVIEKNTFEKLKLTNHQFKQQFNSKTKADRKFTGILPEARVTNILKGKNASKL